jgi:hypothetical protein
LVNARRPALQREGAIVLDDDTTLLIATVLFYGAVVVIGPIFVHEADMDLGGGIGMAPDGQIHVSGARPVAPMNLPDDKELGIVGQVSEPRLCSGAGSEDVALVSCNPLSSPAR